ncbi:2-deoxy-D-gluconate 3-dehydrogenase [Purpureocillium lavendulum]|uniref:2-deoxy-D-gluconate 3-dehydrogenase n=1 Tax=Purpureocillium lavendulum TaxID=1247861 RepID=A0AB34FU18_9HYPO|nr:2-deoxy-D-gluconate 3-dehydrogenase [Purpureocillium lavendulum]
MPRRHQVRMACQRCRKKRAKCDGEDPCERCLEAGLECLFDNSRRESKDDLRAEIERLRRTNEQSDALLDALSSMDDADTYHMVAQGLMDGAVTRQSIYDDLPTKLRIAGIPLSAAVSITSSLRRNSQTASSAGASSCDVQGATCPHCSGALPAVSSALSDGDRSNGLSSERPISDDVSSEADRLPTPGSGHESVPSQSSLAVDDGLQQIDPWTRTGWTIGKVRARLDALLTWDYLPFCLLCKDPFLNDLMSGEGSYCSPALVNSLLALSTRVLDEHHHPQQLLLQRQHGNANGTASSFGWSDSQALFDEAVALISGNKQPDTLPNIQAMGMLALYQVSSGLEAEARELAEAFAAAATDMCVRESLAGDRTDEQYARVRATTYCGAISLVRADIDRARSILKLITAQPAGLHAVILEDDGVALDQPSCLSAPDNGPVTGSKPRQGHSLGQRRSIQQQPAANDAKASILAGEHKSQLSNLQLIPAKIFQLTERVFKLLSSPRTASSDQIVSAYHQCLDWYESFFAMLKTDGSNSPFVLFIHMYYQFCLLSLFRPFVRTSFGGELNAQPREICLQAAQSILGLSQSYAGVFGLHRVSPLVPYFVCAAGLLSLTVEEAGQGMLGAVPVPRFDGSHCASSNTAESPEDAIKRESDDDQMDVDMHHGQDSNGEPQQGTPPASSHVNMPAVARARLLLSEMSAVHPCAVVVEGMLHRAPGRN